MLSASLFLPRGKRQQWNYWDVVQVTKPSKLLPLLTWRSAICDSGLPPTTRHVALTLSLYMNERGSSAYPGAVQLSEDTGLSESTVREHLKRLVDDEWLTLVERGGLKGHRRTANVYQAHQPARFDPAPRTPPGAGGVTAVDPRPDPSSPTPPGADATPRPPGGVTPPSPGGVPLRETATTPPAPGGQLSKNSPEEFLPHAVGDSTTPPDRPGGNDDEDPRLAAVWAHVAECRYRRRQGEPIRNLTRWRATVAAQARAELEPRAVELLARHPSITPEALAAALEDPAGSATVTARYPRTRCSVCDDIGVVETPDGWIPCATCRSALTTGTVG